MSEVALYTLNVGHGLCQVLLLPKRRAIVVDGGAFATRKTLDDFLVRYVDVIVAYIATHNDSDHIGAAIHILPRYPTRDRLHEIWMLLDRPAETIPLLEYAISRHNAGTIRDFVYANLGEERRREPRVVFQDPESGCHVDLLYPGMMHNLPAFHRAQASAQAQNRTNVVLRVTRGRSSALITGDADLESVRVIKEEYGFSVKTNIISVPHHGGRIPSVRRKWQMDDLCRATEPAYAIVSSGTSRTTVRSESLEPFVKARAHVCCTQITSACHPDPASLAPGVMMWRTARASASHVSGVACCGQICAVLDEKGARLLKSAGHRAAVTQYVRPSGTPLCLHTRTALGDTSEPSR